MEEKESPMKLINIFMKIHHIKYYIIIAELNE